jgi:hypothetical protein
VLGVLAAFAVSLGLLSQSATPAHATAAGLKIVKYTNGVNTDNAPPPNVKVCETVTWTYEVSIFGVVDPTDAAPVTVNKVTGLVDDGGPDASFNPTFVGGDTGINVGAIELGEVWIFTASDSSPVLGPYSNTVTVTGFQAADNAMVVASDSSGYNGVSCEPPPPPPCPHGRDDTAPTHQRLTAAWLKGRGEGADVDQPDLDAAFDLNADDGVSDDGDASSADQSSAEANSDDGDASSGDNSDGDSKSDDGDASSGDQSTADKNSDDGDGSSGDASGCTPVSDDDDGSSDDDSNGKSDDGDASSGDKSDGDGKSDDGDASSGDDSDGQSDDSDASSGDASDGDAKSDDGDASSGDRSE